MLNSARRARHLIAPKGKAMKKNSLDFFGFKWRLMAGVSVGLIMVLALLSPTNLMAAINSNAYVSNFSTNTVTVINSTNNSVVITIPGFLAPTGLAMTVDGTKVYVANSGGGTVAVLNTANNTIATAIPVGLSPTEIVASPDGKHIYVTNQGSGTVSVIDTATNLVSATVNLGGFPAGLIVTPDNAHLYVTDAY